MTNLAIRKYIHCLLSSWKRQQIKKLKIKYKTKWNEFTIRFDLLFMDKQNNNRLIHVWLRCEYKKNSDKVNDENTKKAENSDWKKRHSKVSYLFRIVQCTLIFDSCRWRCAQWQWNSLSQFNRHNDAMGIMLQFIIFVVSMCRAIYIFSTWLDNYVRFSRVLALTHTLNGVSLLFFRDFFSLLRYANSFFYDVFFCCMFF